MLWPVYNGRMPEKRLPKAFLHLLRKEWPFLIVLFVILLVLSYFLTGFFYDASSILDSFRGADLPDDIRKGMNALNIQGFVIPFVFSLPAVLVLFVFDSLVQIRNEERDIVALLLSGKENAPLFFLLLRFLLFLLVIFLVVPCYYLMMFFVNRSLCESITLLPPRNAVYLLYGILLVCFLLVNYVAYKIGFRKKRLLRLLREND